MRVSRAALVGLLLGALAIAPLSALLVADAGHGSAPDAAGGFGPDAARGFGLMAARGLQAGVDAVGLVLVPQLLLAVAVLGLALRKLLAKAAGVGPVATPTWLDPAIESALLLGMLGTLSGMVRGFVGLSPDELEPGPLVHALGTALRSSLVGFSIALVGVWTRLGEDPRAVAVAGADTDSGGLPA